MEKQENYNHPEKGKSIKVQPITKLKDIKTIKELLLKSNPRNYALFTVGINTNLRASDLLNLKVEQVRGLKAKESFEITEQKTKKPRRLTLNKSCIDSIRDLLASKENFKDSDYLFQNTRTGNKLTVPYFSGLVKLWCKKINLKGNYASHTLRKTWGYHQRKTFKISIPVLMECFNHSTQRQTFDYLCIQPEEIENVYLNEL